jgi:hypothetical protein
LKDEIMTTETAATPSTTFTSADAAKEKARKEGPFLLKIDGANATVQAANGRVVVCKKVDALEYYKLTRVLGASASNSATIELAMLAASIVKIDEHFIPAATKEGHIEHTIGMLGFEGLAAVGEGLQALSEQTQAGSDASKN